jgi:hypothetical protein
MVRLPCPKHRWHDVAPLDVAVIVATLTGRLADATVEEDWPFHGESADDHLECPLVVATWAKDCEMYLEHTVGALISAGLARETPDGLQPIPETDRDPSTIGVPA